MLCNIDILVCVETLLSPSIANIQYPGFASFRLDRTYSSGGEILPLTRKSIAYKEITNLKCPNKMVEICGVRITSARPAFNLIVCYRSPDLTLLLEHWNQILSNIKDEQHIILVGDSHVSENLRTERKIEVLNKICPP